MATTYPVSSTLDQATLEAFGAAQKIDPTPPYAPAPYFKLGEPVIYIYRRPNAPNHGRGAIIKAVAWKADTESYIYKLISVEQGTIFQPVFAEAELLASRYGVGEVVTVKAFDTTTKCTIEMIYVSDGGEFTYEIGAGFRARAKDIVGIVARRYY